jgi:hypothetical protein
MNPDHQALLDRLPDRPERSKLAPYRDLIRSLRQKRYTFREIAGLLATNYGLKVDHTTIVDFTKRRPNRSDVSLVSTAERHNPLAPSSPVPATTLPRSTQPPQIRVQASTPNVPHKRFHYDPEEGLTLSDKDLNLKPRKD